VIQSQIAYKISIIQSKGIAFADELFCDFDGFKYPFGYSDQVRLT